MLSMKTLKPKLPEQNHDDLFLAIRRRLKGGTQLSTVCAELGITTSTASNIMLRTGTSIKEQRERV